MDLKAEIAKMISQNLESTFSIVETKLKEHDRAVRAAMEDYVLKLSRDNVNTHKEAEKAAEELDTPNQEAEELDTANQGDKNKLPIAEKAKKTKAKKKINKGTKAKGKRETEKGAENELYTEGDKIELLEQATMRIVGYGIVEAKSETIHNRPMPLDSLRVSIKEVIVETAKLPHPNEIADMHTVGDAIGSHVAWPQNCVQLKKN